MMVYDIDQKWLRLWVGLLSGDVDDLWYVAHDPLDEHLVDPDILIERRLSQQTDSLHSVGQEITKSSRLLQHASTKLIILKILDNIDQQCRYLCTLHNIKSILDLAPCDHQT